jgi:hypothetical protein
MKSLVIAVGLVWFLEAGSLATAQVPEEARRQLVENLGPALLIFRDKVQGELKLTAEQREKLEDRLRDTIQEAMAFFQKLQDTRPEEREKEVHAYRKKVSDKLVPFVKDELKPEQFKRFYQLILQHEAPFSLLDPDVGKELKITDEQRKKFMAVVQELEKQLRPLLEEANTKGNHEEIRPKALKVRAEYGGRLEAVLTEAQKKQWQEVLGNPFVLGD